MTKFKASPSGFVFGTVLLLLVLVIYTANAACSSAMMFNSSSLEVAGEFARESQGTTEIALDHLDRIPGRVLQSVVDDTLGLLTKNFDSIAKGVKPYSGDLGGQIDKLTYLKDLYEYLDTNYCSNVYCYSLNTSTCGCKQEYQAPVSTPGCGQYAVYHCCKGSNGACSECCEGKANDGLRRDNIVTVPIDESSIPPLPPSLSSSQYPCSFLLLMLFWLSLL